MAGARLDMSIHLKYDLGTLDFCTISVISEKISKPPITAVMIIHSNKPVYSLASQIQE